MFIWVKRIIDCSKRWSSDRSSKQSHNFALFVLFTWNTFSIIDSYYVVCKASLRPANPSQAREFGQPSSSPWSRRTKREKTVTSSRGRPDIIHSGKWDTVLSQHTAAGGSARCHQPRHSRWSKDCDIMGQVCGKRNRGRWSGDLLRRIRVETGRLRQQGETRLIPSELFCCGFLVNSPLVLWFFMHVMTSPLSFTSHTSGNTSVRTVAHLATLA